MIGIIKNSAKEYIKVVFSIIIIFIITRLFECGYIVCVVKQQIDLNLLFTRSINFDSLFLILLSIIFLLPVLLINLINKKLAKIILNTLAFIAIFTNIILTLYFLITNTLLTHVVLDFTSNEIFNIVRNEFTFNRFFLCFTSIFIISVSIYVLTKLVERIKIFGKWNFILFGIYTIFTLIGIVNRTYTFKSIDHFDTNYQFLLGNSKHVYFIKSYLNSCSSAKIDISELEIAISKYQNTTNYFDYSDSQYPLMHTESSSNVLGSYFEKREVLPNIVLIISESLSSSFSCGAIGLKRSITSFTDSIADKGLMWSTFFSNADRSYGVLPNILASLPSGIGERGFINMKNSNSSMKYYPNHLSLVQLLKQNGYLTNYFYGGWGNFDNTGRYLKEIGIDNFIHKDNFNIHKYKKDDSKWGFNDKELFSHSFNILKSIEGKRPLFNIYQTISLHSPFNLCETSYFSEQYLTKKLNSLGISKEDVASIPNDILSSIFFSDDALSTFFKEYSKRDDFKNTIFIITGDHAIDLNLTDNALENFHVPLIIYSPLLIKASNFRGACSHIDILPSLAVLLKQNYGLDVASKIHWIGKGLDTSSSKVFDRIIPLKLTSIEMPNFIYNNNVLLNNKVMKLNAHLLLTEELSINNKNKINELYENYKLINNYVCSQDRIWYKEK